MAPRPSVIFDTSSWNQLLKDSQSSHVVSALQKRFFARVSATNVSEIAATPSEPLRKALLSVCASVVGDCLYPPHCITNALIRSFDQDPSLFDWRNVPAEWPELQEKLGELEFFDDDLAKEQCADLRSKGEISEIYTARGAHQLRRHLDKTQEIGPRAFVLIWL